jgi:anti-anti-sigma factor
METYTYIKQMDMMILRPKGEITSRTYPEFEKEMTADICDGMKVMVNLEDVEFVDSQGLVFLLRFRQTADLNNSQFYLFNVNYNFEKVLKRLRLEKILNVTSCPEECFPALADSGLAEPALSV